MVVNLFHWEVVDWILVAHWRRGVRMPAMAWFLHLVYILVAVKPAGLHLEVYEHGIPAKQIHEKHINKWIFEQFNCVNNIGLKYISVYMYIGRSMIFSTLNDLNKMSTCCLFWCFFPFSNCNTNESKTKCVMCHSINVNESWNASATTSTSVTKPSNDFAFDLHLHCIWTNWSGQFNSIYELSYSESLTRCCLFRKKGHSLKH